MKDLKIKIFWWTFFWPDSFLKAFIIWNWRWFQFFGELCFGNFLISFFVARYTLQSPFGVQCSNLKNAGVSQCCDGWTDGHQKGPLIFFILRYIKHYTHIYLYAKEKLSGQTSCGFIFWSSWRVARTIFKITLLGRHFSKMSLKVSFWEKTIGIYL